MGTNNIMMFLFTPIYRVLSFLHVIYMKIIKELFDITSYTASSASPVHCIPTAHLSSDQAPFKCSPATHGRWLPC